MAKKTSKKLAKKTTRKPARTSLPEEAPLLEADLDPAESTCELVSEPNVGATVQAMISFGGAQHVDTQSMGNGQWRVCKVV
jgi:hypothetical protein